MLKDKNYIIAQCIALFLVYTCIDEWYETLHANDLRLDIDEMLVSEVCIASRLILPTNGSKTRKCIAAIPV